MRFATLPVTESRKELTVKSHKDLGITFTIPRELVEYPQFGEENVVGSATKEAIETLGEARVDGIIQNWLEGAAIAAGTNNYLRQLKELGKLSVDEHLTEALSRIHDFNPVRMTAAEVKAERESFSKDIKSMSEEEVEANAAEIAKRFKALFG